MSDFPHALVTGAASGIGLEVSRRFLKDGISTVFVDRDPDVEEIARSESSAAGTPASSIIADLAESEAVESAAAEALQISGGIDIVVNNAGISPKFHGGPMHIDRLDVETWNRTIAINLTAPYLLSRRLIPHMRDVGWGRIVMMSSRAARTVSPVTSAAYTSTKTGLIGLARQLAFELAASGVTVNTVAPGPVWTPIAEASSQEKREEMIRQIPVGRYGTPEEIASLIAFITSRDAGFMTGAIVDINGGGFLP